MANLFVADRVLVTFHGLLFNQRLMSTFCYGLSTVTGSPTQAAGFDALHTKFTAGGGLVEKYLACIPAQYELTEVWYQIIAPNRYNKYVRTSGLGVGTLASNNLYTANSAAVILRRGDQGNRRNISTLHVPLGNTVGCMVNGMIGADMETPLTALAVEMLVLPATTGVVAGWAPVINNGPDGPDYTPIVSTQVMQTARTMSRRNVGRGI